MPGTVAMRTEAVPRRRAAVRSERVIAKPAQVVVELHGAFPLHAKDGGYREHGRAALAHASGDLDEVAELGRSDTAPVEAVEDQHDVAPAKVGQSRLASRAGRQREVGRGLAEAQAGHGAGVYPSRA